MTKRLMTAIAVLAAALVAAGCGGGGTGDATEDALKFLPKDSPLVVVLETDPEGEQYKRLDKLLGKFPFAGQVRQQFKQGIEQNGLDFDKDVKPILGNELVVGVPNARALQADDSPVVGAMKPKDAGKAEELIKKDGAKSGSAEGADIYKSGETFSAVKDGVLVIASTQADMEAALKRSGGDDGMTGDELDTLLAGVEGDGVAKVGADLEAIVAADPDAAEARKSKFVAGLREYGQVLTVEEDGIKSDFKLKTEGLSEQDMPLAAGSEAAPVVRRASDVNFGTRNLAQTFRFGETTAKAVNPTEYNDFVKDKQDLNEALGIDIDRDVIDQFEGDASLSVGIDGGFAVRSDLKDPAAFRATLRKAAPKLKRAFKGKSVGIAVPKKPNGFYAVATADGKKYTFAVIDDKFVLATDAARAAQFAAQSASPVQNAKGALVMALDTRTLANQVAKRLGQSGAGLFTGALGDATGWVESRTDGMDGSFKLTIK